MADDIAESYSDFTEDDFGLGGGYDYAAGGEIPEDDVDALIGEQRNDPVQRGRVRICWTATVASD